MTYRNAPDRPAAKIASFERREAWAMTSILFVVLYLAVPLGLATLALFGRGQTDEEAPEPSRVSVRSGRRPH